MECFRLNWTTAQEIGNDLVEEGFGVCMILGVWLFFPAALPVQRPTTYKYFSDPF
jgi:hypothetical protein